MLNTSVLVLNRVYLPVHVTTVRRAFSLIYQGTARAVDESYQTFDFESWMGRVATNGTETIGTSSGRIRVPRVVVLITFDRMPKRHIRFSRSNIFSRDRFTCQYCGEQPSRVDLNLDHVVPRAQGGRTTWENVVTCCVPCNRRKGGRTPQQARMLLSRAPSRPRWSPLLTVAPAAVRYQEWRPFLDTGDAAALRRGCVS
jgi:5-methylcytosine-specific restriction endonuclease McrA